MRTNPSLPLQAYRWAIVGADIAMLQGMFQEDVAGAKDDFRSLTFKLGQGLLFQIGAVHPGPAFVVEASGASASR
jgi:hypothetical protein